MGIFDRFRNRKKKKENSQAMQNGSSTQNTLNVSKETFITFTEKRDSEEITVKNTTFEEWKMVVEFLRRDFEKVGYLDAMNELDEGWRARKLESIKSELILLIEDGLLKTSWKISDTDTKIAIASRCGLIDLIEELRSLRSKLSEQHKRLTDIKKELSQDNEDSLFNKTVVYKYNCGFNRGVIERLRGNTPLLDKE